MSDSLSFSEVFSSAPSLTPLVCVEPPLMCRHCPGPRDPGVGREGSSAFGFTDRLMRQMGQQRLRRVDSARQPRPHRHRDTAWDTASWKRRPPWGPEQCVWNSGLSLWEEGGVLLAALGPRRGLTPGMQGRPEKSMARPACGCPSWVCCAVAAGQLAFRGRIWAGLSSPTEPPPSPS